MCNYLLSQKYTDTNIKYSQYLFEENYGTYNNNKFENYLSTYITLIYGMLWYIKYLHSFWSGSFLSVTMFFYSCIKYIFLTYFLRSCLLGDEIKSRSSSESTQTSEYRFTAPSRAIGFYITTHYLLGRMDVRFQQVNYIWLTGHLLPGVWDRMA